MLSGRWDNHRVKEQSTLLLDHVLEQMPAAVERDDMDDDDDDDEHEDEFVSSDDKEDEAATTANIGDAADRSLSAATNVDLLSDMFGSSSVSAVASTSEVPTSDIDLLGDMFGSSPAPAVSPSIGGDLFGMMGETMVVDTLAKPSSRFPSMEVYSRNGVIIVFSFAKPEGDNAASCVVVATATNNSATLVTGYQLQISLPKVSVRRVAVLLPPSLPHTHPHPYDICFFCRFT